MSNTGPSFDNLGSPANISLRERLLNSTTKPAGEFVLAGSGQKVYLRRWTIGDRMRMVALSDDKARGVERQGEMLALILCDENNKLLFPPGDAGVFDLALGGDAERLIEAALAANGLGKDAKKDALEKKGNSNPTGN